MVLRSKLTLALSLSALLVGVLLYLGVGSFGDPPVHDLPAVAPREQVETIEESYEPPPEVAQVAPKDPPATAPDPQARRVVTYRPLLTQGGWTLLGRIVALDEEEQFGSNAVEEPDAQPMKGVSVRLKPHPRHPDEHPIATHERVTKADGRFEFRGLPGDVWLRFEIDEPRSAFRTLSFRLGEPREEGVKELGDIALDPAQRLTFRLVSPNGAPIRKGSVLVNATSANPRRSSRLSSIGIHESRRRAVEIQKDGQEGLYVLERAVSGPMYLDASAPGHSPTGRVEFESPLEDGPLEIELETGHTIAGQVLTSDGQPIVRAELAGGLASTAERARTDERGEFLFEGLAAGQHTVLVRARGFVDDRREDVPTGTDALLFELRPEAVVTGKVIAAASREPVTQAHVKLRETNSGTSYAAFSGGDGRFAIHGVSAGQFDLSVDHGDYASLALETPLDLNEGAMHSVGELALTPGLTIRGTVADSETLMPVPGATVRFNQTSQAGEAPARSVTTGEDGTFEVIALSAGEYAVEVVATNYVPAEPRTVVFSDDSNPALELLLDAGETLEGTVVDARTGDPVPDATITVISANATEGFRRSRPSASSTSDEDGAFELTGLATSPVTVSVTHNDYPALQLSAVTGEALRIELGGSGGVHGIVRRGGAPLEGVSLGFSQVGGGANTSVATGLDGRYEVRGLRAGDYRVNLRREQRARTLRTVVHENQMTEFNIDEPVGIRITGQVSVDEVRVQSGNIFAIDPQQGGRAGRSAIGTEGEYELEVPGPGRYSLILQLRSGGENGTRVPLVVPTGVQELRRDINISGGIVEGRVVDADSGTGLGNVQVIATVPQGGRESFISLINSLSSMARTDDSGHFAIRNLESGTYSLRAFARSFADARLDGVRVAGGTTRVGDLRLVRGVEFSIAIVDEGRKPVEGATVVLRDPNGSIVGLQQPTLSRGDGVAALTSVATGTYRASVQHPSYAPALMDVVVTDEAQPVHVILRPGGMLKVTVSTSDGSPLTGVAVHAVDGNGWNVLSDRIDFRGSAPGASVTDGQGQLDAGHLTPGDYQVFAITPDGRQSPLSAVTIERGETKEVVVSLDG